MRRKERHSSTTSESTHSTDDAFPYVERRYTVEQSAILGEMSSSESEGEDTYSEDHEPGEEGLGLASSLGEEEYKTWAVGEAEAEVGRGLASQGQEGGIEFHAVIVSDAYSGKHCFPESGQLKLRRPLPQIRAKGFFSQVLLLE